MAINDISDNVGLTLFVTDRICNERREAARVYDISLKESMEDLKEGQKDLNKRVHQMVMGTAAVLATALITFGSLILKGCANG